MHRLEGADVAPVNSFPLWELWIEDEDGVVIGVDYERAEQEIKAGRIRVLALREET